MYLRISNRIHLTYILVTSIVFSSGCAITTPKSGVMLNDDGWIAKESYYEKNVHYGTTRVDRCEGVRNTDSSCIADLTRLNTGNKYTRKSILYGSATVKIPYSKKVGGTSGMSLVALEHDISLESFLGKLSEDDLLVFIHGFNTSFTSAAIRTAQIAHDTNFKGEAVFFSWPSAENPLTYASDKKRAKENFEVLADFLITLASNTDQKIHIVGHSMGTYLLVNSLAVIDKKIEKNPSLLERRRVNSSGKLFGQIILAAPDISKDDYSHRFSEYNISKLANKITLYSSENDYVLSTSRLMNFFVNGVSQVRLGDSSKDFFVVEGMDTIDTRQEISSQFFGHSFYASYRSLVSDMYILLRHGSDPDDRMLQKVIDRKGNILWFIRD